MRTNRVALRVHHHTATVTAQDVGKNTGKFKHSKSRCKLRHWHKMRWWLVYACILVLLKRMYGADSSTGATTSNGPYSSEELDYAMHAPPPTDDHHPPSTDPDTTIGCHNTPYSPFDLAEDLAIRDNSPTQSPSTNTTTYNSTPTNPTATGHTTITIECQMQQHPDGSSQPYCDVSTARANTNTGANGSGGPPDPEQTMLGDQHPTPERNNYVTNGSGNPPDPDKPEPTTQESNPPEQTTIFQIKHENATSNPSEHTTPQDQPATLLSQL